MFLCNRCSTSRAIRHGSQISLVKWFSFQTVKHSKWLSHMIQHCCTSLFNDAFAMKNAEKRAPRTQVECMEQGWAALLPSTIFRPYILPVLLHQWILQLTSKPCTHSSGQALVMIQTLRAVHALIFTSVVSYHNQVIKSEQCIPHEFRLSTNLTLEKKEEQWMGSMG